MFSVKFRVSQVKNLIIDCSYNFYCFPVISFENFCGKVKTNL